MIWNSRVYVQWTHLSLQHCNCGDLFSDTFCGVVFTVPGFSSSVWCSVFFVSELCNSFQFFSVFIEYFSKFSFFLRFFKFLLTALSWLISNTEKSSSWRQMQQFSICPTRLMLSLFLLMQFLFALGLLDFPDGWPLVSSSYPKLLILCDDVRAT